MYKIKNFFLDKNRDKIILFSFNNNYYYSNIRIYAFYIVSLAIV